jgi:ATP-dependent DNA helicase PIF1
MMIRNIDPPKLCNGTRLVIKTMCSNVIVGVILTGVFFGEEVFIPRIPMIPVTCPFNFTRLQFPLIPAFAITVNKAQGQTFKVVGLHLSSPCFSHGQLYVGCSRVGSPKGLYVLCEDNKTANIVYPEVLQQ